MPLHVSSTVVLIIMRSKLYYTASGIVTPVGGRPVHRLREDYCALSWLITKIDRLCGLVVRVSGYRYRGPGFDPRRYQIF